MRTLKNLHLIFLTLLFTNQSLIGQSCNDGSYSWDDDIAAIFAGGCTGCHGGTSGLTLTTYDGIASGGNQCATDNLLTGTTLVQTITSTNTICSGGVINNSMNSNCGNCISNSEISDIQTWINEGAQETCPIIAPVDYLSMGAKLHGDQVIISWTTSSEVNNQEFEVFHSTDLDDFRSIGKIAGSGTSNEQQAYQLKHETPASGLNYYRVVQTDFNGDEQVGKLLSINVRDDSRNNVLVYPNPSHDNLFIVFDRPVKSKATIFMYDIYNTLITQRAINPDQGRMLEIITDELPVGSYRIMIHLDSEEIITKKLIKI